MPYSFSMNRGVLMLLLFYSGLLPFVPLGESLLQFYLPRIINRCGCVLSLSACSCMQGRGPFQHWEGHTFIEGSFQRKIWRQKLNFLILSALIYGGHFWKGKHTFQRNIKTQMEFNTIRHFVLFFKYVFSCRSTF